MSQKFPALPARPATARDVPELLVLQRCCWVDEAIANDTLDIAALHETLADVRAGLNRWHTWCLRHDGRLIGAVRARRDGASWHLGRLMVAPDQRRSGLGRALLRHAEAQAPPGIDTFVLETGRRSTDNIRFYRSCGYRLAGSAGPHAVRLVKPAAAETTTNRAGTTTNRAGGAEPAASGTGGAEPAASGTGG
ncbi:hypothetical protein Athai_67010 [Actinocatenispora thailandica]|uniref:N-acetyltransferase domain-containing protein n=1 Tax=Actinocatenispora thailandica TaxID=227318 RepID=A0A7R7I0E4_9ACTN|nr:GNAT family N-acetyltransferase [Actinocatenispora thailandica]BCJ39198.1 hypothetical protein Athai_67010 [Actinocatenispora thailandica]